MSETMTRQGGLYEVWLADVLFITAIVELVHTKYELRSTNIPGAGRADSQWLSPPLPGYAAAARCSAPLCTSV